MCKKEEIPYRGYLIQTYYHDDGGSPREWDNLGTIAYKHRNYCLGEEEISDPVDWLMYKLDMDHDQVEKMITRDFVHPYPTVYSNEVRKRLEDMFYDRYIALPIYLYDHSGITINTTGYNHLGMHGYFDSGQVGYIYASKDAIRKEYGWKNITEKRRPKILEYLEGEVKEFNQYLTGEVYGYVIDDIDSCCNFYDYEYMLSEAKSIIDCQIKENIKKHAERVKVWCRNRVPLKYREPLKLRGEVWIAN